MLFQQIFTFRLEIDRPIRYNKLYTFLKRTERRTKMKIAIVGLGLIGGSICKALKKSTFHHIMGLDADGEVCKKALDSGAID